MLFNEGTSKKCGVPDVIPNAFSYIIPSGLLSIAIIFQCSLTTGIVPSS